MKKALLSLAVAGLALSAANSAYAQQPLAGGTTMPVISHPLCNGKASFFPIAEAYPARSFGFTATDKPSGQCLEVALNRRFCGTMGQQEDNTTAAPGALALCTVNKAGDDFRQRLDVNKFATCPPGFGQAFVQSYRLTKDIPASVKCPGVFVAQKYTQFGEGIRTWWTLIYTPPGTTFTLDVTVRCIGDGTVTGIPEGAVQLHIDRWVWKVVVTFESLQAVIDVLHSNSLSTSEIPCIAAENMYIALKRSVERIERAFRGISPATGDPVMQQVNAQNELFNLEALIIAFCAFDNCFFFDPSVTPAQSHVFSTFPPSNDVQMGMLGPAGIIDTAENPCCCKLLVDIERLAIDYGIVSN